jgi:hypothetical protein
LTTCRSLRGQFEKASFIERDIGYSRHAPATPAFGFSPQPDHGDASPGDFFLRHGRLGGDPWRVGYSLSASTDQASRQVHDFTLDEVQHVGAILDMPEFDLLGPARKPVFQ